MTKTEAKHAAQAAIMHGIEAAIFNASEGEHKEQPPEVLSAMYEQAARVGKLLGYASWPGIF
jgi:hypothetical protein